MRLNFTLLTLLLIFSIVFSNQFITNSKTCYATSDEIGTCNNTNVRGDGNVWQIDEIAGTPLIAYINITNTSFTSLRHIEIHTNSSYFFTTGPHYVSFYVFNYSSDDWLVLYNLTTNEYSEVISILNKTDVIENDTLQMKFEHTEDTASAHDGIFIDFVGVSINAEIEVFYPVNDTVFGPSQCWIDVQGNITTFGTNEQEDIECRLYNSTHELIATNTTRQSETNFSLRFDITPSSNTQFYANCSITDEDYTFNSNTQEFEIIGQSLCYIDDGGNKTYVYSQVFENTTYSDSIGIITILIGFWLLTLVVIDPKMKC